MEVSARESRLRRQRRKLHREKWTTDSISVKARQLYSAGQGWFVLALVGITIGFIAAFLNIVTEWLSDFKMGHCSVGLYLNKEFCCAGQEECDEWKYWASFSAFRYFIYVVFSTLFAFLSATLVFSFAPYAAGSGISEIKCIIAGFVMKGFLGGRTLAIKSITLPLAIASGLSVGKEGPSVHYAVCVGNTIASQFAKYREHDSKMREILCACTAAGVAVAFGSPMGGVLFALEEISSSFQLKIMWKSYFCALVATGVLAMINPFRTGQLVLFSVKYDTDWHFFEVFFYIIIGIFGGFLGIFVSKWNLRTQGFRKKYLSKFPVEEATILAALTAVICYFNEFLRVDMTESMQILFHECRDGWNDVTCESQHRSYVLFSLILGVIIRTFLVIISYGCKVPAGIFVPSLAIGALFGRFVGTIVQALQESFPRSSVFASCPLEGPCITPGTYAFLGAGAGLSGVMNLTITVVVIMFELTGALNYILPSMIVIGVTRAIGDTWGKGGIADQMIWFNGYPFIDTKETHDFNAPVEAAMISKIVSIPTTGWILRDVQALLKNHHHQSFPIVADDGYLEGYINRSDLEDAVETARDAPDKYVTFSRLHEAPIRLDQFVNTSVITADVKLPLEQVVNIFAKVGPRVIYVQSEGKLRGLVTRKDVLRYQFKLEHRLSPRDTSAAEEIDRKLWEMLQSLVTRLGAIYHSIRRTNRP